MRHGSCGVGRRSATPAAPRNVEALLGIELRVCATCRHNESCEACEHTGIRRAGAQARSAQNAIDRGHALCYTQNRYGRRGLRRGPWSVWCGPGMCLAGMAGRHGENTTAKVQVEGVCFSPCGARIRPGDARRRIDRAASKVTCYRGLCRNTGAGRVTALSESGRQARSFVHWPALALAHGRHWVVHDSSAGLAGCSGWPVGPLPAPISGRWTG